MKLLEETLKSIKPADEEAIKKAWSRMDSLSKPIGSLGKLEEIAVQISGITRKVKNEINKKMTVIMCSDNGICEEGVSACPQELTALLAENYVKEITGIGVLSKHVNADMCVVDIGIRSDVKDSRILNKKVAYGTKNMGKEPAMTREEAVKAIETGIELVDKFVKEGYDLFGTGEAGIGNTATSAAVISVLSQIDSDKIVGKGSGLTDEGFLNKKRAVKQAIEINKPNKEDVIDVIAKIGGFDIAGICGCFLGAAKNRVPIVIDGIISASAALCAYKMNANVKDFLIPSHLSAEPGIEYVTEAIGLNPCLHMEMRLGEGSGCPLQFFMIESALCLMNNMATLAEASIIDSKFLVDIREK
ncbi:nicotinate-nucleotide--dimethylbenzimidazole phosphoribosyltransferase [Clostridium tetani]|uniref:nicotinate-nucleotide--dimethylbenzimidazole phosphoribosyltransferase n=1 Tax=Clostridium tetani TaxID=1513 RepID=UPI0003C0CE7C|nr:nicotinate-nucleotide--dimethylbenzimidazole phosphoribosyltransferase [Clostridium tetani]CDI50477.1 nicotinate-nucleotide--dimethylbenzimidazolephosphoribosyltransferase [Clostridium tetani 12124569]